MIDEKMLFNRETIAREIGHTLDAEIIRLARRYLVLRRVAVKVYLGGDWIEEMNLTQPLTGCWRVANDAPGLPQLRGIHTSKCQIRATGGV